MSSWLNFSLKTKDLSRSEQNFWAVLLIALLGLTRFNHFGSAIVMPDASWAVFFMAGFLVQKKRVFSLLMLEAALIDYFAIRQGVSGWCVSSAYVFLVPSYAALWFAGRCFNQQAKALHWKTFSYFFAWMILGVTVAFFISNESFYRLSGKFNDLPWLDFYQHVSIYYWAYLMTTTCYVGALTSVVIAVSLLPSRQISL